MAKPTKTTKSDPPKKAAAYTSVYLDETTRDALTKLVGTSGRSRSQVISSLVRQAAGDDTQMRVVELVTELSRLVALR